ncbi:MAG: GNAT family N-acetyltransferase [Deltaproteobacteria bacterium]|nr:GNAT family N-acetyltransferase [Deltaproteobacteria bacterium]
MAATGLTLGNQVAAVLEECRFEDVLPIWQAKLWPGRISKIESNSAMKWLGGIDLQLMQEPASFWRILVSKKKINEPEPSVIAVLSGHFGGLIPAPNVQNSDSANLMRSFRTRGLYVAPEFRGLGAASAVMNAAFTEAKRTGCEVAWTFPRKSAMPAYEKMGFQRVGPWIGEKDPSAGEFGPNCFAIRHLAP